MATLTLDNQGLNQEVPTFLAACMGHVVCTVVRVMNEARITYVYWSGIKAAVVFSRTSWLI